MTERTAYPEEYWEGWHDGFETQDAEIIGPLHAEVERLRAVLQSLQNEATMTERTVYDVPWLPNEMADLLDALARSTDRCTLSYSETAHIARCAAQAIRWLSQDRK